MFWDPNIRMVCVSAQVSDIVLWYLVGSYWKFKAATQKHNLFLIRARWPRLIVWHSIVFLLGEGHNLQHFLLITSIPEVDRLWRWRDTVGNLWTRLPHSIVQNPSSTRVISPHPHNKPHLTCCIITHTVPQQVFVACLTPVEPKASEFSICSHKLCGWPMFIQWESAASDWGWFPGSQSQPSFVLRNHDNN